MLLRSQISQNVLSGFFAIYPIAIRIIVNTHEIGKAYMILKRIPYQIAIRSFKNPYFREIGLAMKDRTKLTPATRKFIEYLINYQKAEAE